MKFTAQLTVIATMAAMLQFSTAAPVQISNNNANNEARGLGSLALDVVAPELAVPWKVAKTAAHVAHKIL
jgi:hypothetical protein